MGPSLRIVALVVALLIGAAFYGGLTGQRQTATHRLTECQAVWLMLEAAAPSAYIVNRCP